MGTPKLVVDPLPMKRLLALEEDGLEHFPPEQTQEEKPLALLQRIDFGKLKEKDSKKSRTSKDKASQPAAAWPWQGLVDHLHQAQQELSIILDLITQVEANEALNVANVVRPKLLPPQEACLDLSVRASSKLQHFHDVGNYLKKTAKALERQVEREAIFYGALMRLQRNWKVKRQKGLSAIPGGHVAFTLDLSFPVLSEAYSASPLGATSSCIINVDQNSDGLLVVHPPPGRSFKMMNLTLGGSFGRTPSVTDTNLQTGKPANTSEAGPMESEGLLVKGVMKGVEKGAKEAHFVLRNILAAVYDEQVFESVVRDALVPSPALHVTGIGNSCLQLSIDHTASIAFEVVPLVEKELTVVEDMNVHTGNTSFRPIEREASSTVAQESGQTEDPYEACNVPVLSDLTQERTPPKSDPEELEHEQVYPKEKSLKICLQQAFFQSSFGRWILANKSLPVTGKGSHGSSVQTRIRESSSLSAVGAGKDPLLGVQAALLTKFSAIIRHRKFCAEVLGMLEKQTQNIQHLHVYFHPTWDPFVTAWDIEFAVPTMDSRRRTIAQLNCRIIVRDESLFIEGLEGLLMFEKRAKEKLQEVHYMTKYACNQSELSMFLLHQVAVKVIDWLYEEITILGINVKREYLSLTISMAHKDDISLVAYAEVNSNCVNWWIKSKAGFKGLYKSENLSHKSLRNFLGPKSPEVLRTIIIEVLNSLDARHGIR